jgi:hypothetical protein
MQMSAYTVILSTRTDRDLTEKQPSMAWIEAGASRSSLACSVTDRYLQFTLHVDAESIAAAVAEAFRVTERAARVAGFGYEAEELRAPLRAARREDHAATCPRSSGSVTSTVRSPANRHATPGIMGCMFKHCPTCKCPAPRLFEVSVTREGVIVDAGDDGRTLIIATGVKEPAGIVAAWHHADRGRYEKRLPDGRATCVTQGNRLMP